MSFLMVLALPPEVLRDLIGVLKLEISLLTRKNEVILEMRIHELTVQDKRIQFELLWSLSTIQVGDNNLKMKVRKPPALFLALTIFRS